MTDLHSLLARIESATGPDNDLARETWEALTGECTHRNTHFVELENDERVLECADCGADTYGKDKWSAIFFSLDAAIALCDRALPGCGYSIWKADADWIAEQAWASVGAPGARVAAYAATPALALCAAIVKARIETCLSGFYP